MFGLWFSGGVLVVFLICLSVFLVMVSNGNGFGRWALREKLGVS